nr:Zgc:114181 [Danio rerio]
MISISVFCLLLCTGASAFRFEELTQYVNTHQDEFVETLRQWIAVESDSSDVTKRADLHRMMDMTAEKLRLIGGKVEMIDIGTQTLANGSSIDLPKVVTAQFGDDPSKHTVCVYGHVDVQPAKMEDGWSTEPYELTDLNGNLYGRGASDNKAPVEAWIHALEVYKALNIDLPEPFRTSQEKASSCCPSEASTTACTPRTRRSADATTLKEPNSSSRTCTKCPRSRSTEEALQTNTHMSSVMQIPD